MAENDPSRPRVILLPTGPASGGAAQNFFRLLREGDFTGCDYIALSDQNEIWLPSKLTRAVARLNEANAQAYSSEALAFWPNGRRKLIGKSHPLTN
jgi:rhamnosyltransferase